MESPCPSFTYGPTGHCLERARLAERAQAEVHEDAAQHDEGGNVLQDVTDGDRPAPEGAGSGPENDARNKVDDTARDDFPVLNLLAGVEKAGVGGLHLFGTADDAPDVPHPARIPRSPAHGLDPIQCLQGEECHEGNTEPGMQGAAEGAPAEDGS